MSEKKLFEAGGGGAGKADLRDLAGRERIGHENGINPDALNATGDKMIEPVSAPVNIPKSEAPKPAAPKPKAPAPKPAEPAPEPKGDPSGGLAAIPWKQIAIVAGAAGLLAALIALLRKCTKSIKLRFNKSVRTLARMQKDFTLEKKGLDMRAVLPGVGSRLNDFLTRAFSGSAFMNNGKTGVMDNTKSGRKFKDGVIGLYPFCDIYKEELRNDLTMAQTTFNKIKIAADTAGKDATAESYNGKVYRSFAEAFASDRLNESDSQGQVNESIMTLAALAPMVIRGGAFVVNKIKNGKADPKEAKTVQVTKQSTREICYAILNNFFEKYISFEDVSKKMGVDIKGLSDVDKSSIDKLGKVIKAYSNPDGGSVVKQYVRVKTAYDKMLGHYLNIGNGIIKNFEKYTKADDEKHENLLIASKEKLSAMWEQQKDQYEHLFPYVMMEIVNDGSYAQYIDFITESVLPVFKTGIAGDADYILDVMPKKGDYFLLSQTAQDGNIGNKAVCKITKDFNKDAKTIEFRLLGLFSGTSTFNSDGSCTLNDLHNCLDKTKYSNKPIELEYAKFLSLDPHIVENKDDFKKASGDPEAKKGEVIAVTVTDENREQYAKPIATAVAEGEKKKKNGKSANPSVNPQDVQVVYIYVEPEQKISDKGTEGYIVGYSTQAITDADYSSKGVIEIPDGKADSASDNEPKENGTSGDDKNPDKEQSQEQGQEQSAPKTAATKLGNASTFITINIKKFISRLKHRSKDGDNSPETQGQDQDNEEQPVETSQLKVVIPISTVEQSPVVDTNIQNEKDEPNSVAKSGEPLIYEVTASVSDSADATRILVLFDKEGNSDEIKMAKIFLQDNKKTDDTAGYAISRQLRNTTVESLTEYINNSDFDWIRVNGDAKVGGTAGSVTAYSLLSGIDGKTKSKFYNIIASMSNSENAPITVSGKEYNVFDSFIEELQKREMTRSSNDSKSTSYLFCKDEANIFAFHIIYDSKDATVDSIIYAYKGYEETGKKPKVGKIIIESGERKVNGEEFVRSLKEKYKHIYTPASLDMDSNFISKDYISELYKSIEDTKSGKRTLDNNNTVKTDISSVPAVLDRLFNGELQPNDVDGSKETQDKENKKKKEETYIKVTDIIGNALNVIYNNIKVKPEQPAENPNAQQAQNNNNEGPEQQTVGQRTGNGDGVPDQISPTIELNPNKESISTDNTADELNEKKQQNIVLDINVEGLKNSDVFSEVSDNISEDKKQATIDFVFKSINYHDINSDHIYPVKFSLLLSVASNTAVFKVNDTEGFKTKFDGKTGGLIFKTDNTPNNTEKVLNFVRSLIGKEKVKIETTAQAFTAFLTKSYGDLTLTMEEKKESLNDAVKESIKFNVSYSINDKIIESAAFNTGINRKVTSDKDASQYYILSECMWSMANDNAVKKSLANKVVATLKSRNTKEALMEYAKSNSNVEFTRNFSNMDYIVKNPGNLHSIIGCSLYECAVAVKFNDHNVISNAIGIGVNKIK